MRRASALGSAGEALAVLRHWAPRLAALLLAVTALGVALPAFLALDNALMLAVNDLGAGPEWLSPGARSPHAELRPPPRRHGGRRGDRPAPAPPCHRGRARRRRPGSGACALDPER